MTEILDRVTEAIRKEIGTRHQGLPKGGWDGLMKKAAEAAIRAMFEPTKQMIEDGNTEIDNCIDSWNYDSDSGYCVGSHAAHHTWKVMINAALPNGDRA